MQRIYHSSWRRQISIVVFLLTFLGASDAFAQGKFGIYGIRMMPSGDDPGRSPRGSRIPQIVTFATDQNEAHLEHAS
jgi:hypothetical protein